MQKKSYNPLVSAIVSTYNSESFIEGCIHDLLNQTLFKKNELEIIVIDSASQQNEGLIVKKLMESHPQITYLRTPQRETIYGAWNRGIRLAQGKYITNANTDDRHKKDALEILAQTLESDPTISVAYADQLITNIPNQTFETATATNCFRWPQFSKDTLMEYCCIGPQPMWRNSIHTVQNMFFDEKFEIAGDYDFWLKIAKNHNFLKIDKILGLYYRSPKDENKEFFDSKRTKHETYLIRRKYFLDYNKDLCSSSVKKLITNKTKILFNASNFILDLHVTENINRHIEHLLWQISVLLEILGEEKISKNFSLRFLEFFKNFYMLDLHSKSIGSLHESKREHSNNFDNNINGEILFLTNIKNLIKEFIDNDSLSTNKIISKIEFHRATIQTFLAQRPTQLNVIDLEYHFFNLSLLLLKLGQITDARKICRDFYLAFGGSHKLAIIFKKSLLVPVRKNPLNDNCPLVSVVIPLYNQKIYLPEAVESVINQSYPKWELIIVNDGSTDDSLAAAHYLAKKYQNYSVRILNHDNKGKGFTRNRGIRESSGKYICVLDADDMLAPTYLSEAVNILNKSHDTGWVTPLTLQFGEANQIFYHFDFDLCEMLKICPSPVTSIFRRSLWEEVKEFDETMIDREDWEFWIKAAECGWTSKHTEDIQFLYRIQPKRFGEKNNINIQSKSQIVKKHPWWFNSFPPATMNCLYKQFSTCNFPNEIINQQNIKKISNLPSQKSLRFNIINSIIKNHIESVENTFDSKTTSFLRLANNYEKKRNVKKALKYLKLARKNAPRNKSVLKEVLDIKKRLYKHINYT